MLAQEDHGDQKRGHAVLSEELFSFYFVPRGLLQVPRNFVYIDVEKNGLEFYPVHSYTQSFVIFFLPVAFLYCLVQILSLKFITPGMGGLTITFTISISLEFQIRL